MKKPEFKDIYFDEDQVVWGQGNNIVGLQELARIQLRELTPEEDEMTKIAYDSAKEIYDTYFNLGQRFQPDGETANKGVKCKITYIHAEKQLVTWRQYNLSERQIEIGFKPARGKFFINAMLKLVSTNKIEFIK